MISDYPFEKLFHLTDAAATNIRIYGRGYAVNSIRPTRADVRVYHKYLVFNVSEDYYKDVYKGRDDVKELGRGHFQTLSRCNRPKLNR